MNERLALRKNAYRLFAMHGVGAMPIKRAARFMRVPKPVALYWVKNGVVAHRKSRGAEYGITVPRLDLAVFVKSLAKLSDADRSEKIRFARKEIAMNYAEIVMSVLVSGAAVAFMQKSYRNEIKELIDAACDKFAGLSTMTTDTVKAIEADVLESLAAFTENLDESTGELANQFHNSNQATRELISHNMKVARALAKSQVDIRAAADLSRAKVEELHRALRGIIGEEMKTMRKKS